MIDAFPRSRTIAFNDDEDDGLEHEHQPRGFSSAREGGFMPRSATVRSQDSMLFQFYTLESADSQFPVHKPEQLPQPSPKPTHYGPPSLSDPIRKCLDSEVSQLHSN